MCAQQIKVGSVCALQVKFGVCPRNAGEILGSICAVQVNFLGSLYAMRVEFGVSLRYAGEI